MIDQQRQALTFQRSYNHFKTLFKIIPQDESLQIKVEDTQGFARYDLRITQNHMSEHPQYNCFRGPIDIFDFVSQNSERVVVEGRHIKFQYIWGFSLKKTRDVVFTLYEQEMDHGKLAHIKIDNLVKQIRQKDMFIANLEQKINKKNIQFQQKLSTCFQKIDALNEAVKTNAEIQQTIKRKHQQSLRNSIQIVNNEVRNNLEALENKYIHLQETLKSFSKQIQKINLQISKMSDMQLEQNIKMQKTCKNSHLVDYQRCSELKKEFEVLYESLAKDLCLLRQGRKEPNQMLLEEKLPLILPNIFGNHQGNSHSQFYQIKSNTISSTKLIRIGANSKCYTFVNKIPINIFGKTRFKVKINKLTNNDLSVGFCTNAALGNLQSYSSHQCIYYQCKNGGEIWKLGGQNITNLGVSSEGDMVECEADIKSGVMRWWKNSVKLTESDIPPEMKGKSIYLSIILFYTNDNVDLTI